MIYAIPLLDVTERDRPYVGGKAFSLALMARKGLRIPGGLCVATEAYRTYLAATGLGDGIVLELNRKRFEDMRWEEIWDAALRIRNMFLKTPMPGDLERELAGPMKETFSDRPVAVRSSAPGEDSDRTSFAGLHESYVNVRGTAAILEHIRLVWASLWSDRALLYRQELGLQVHRSTMAVVVQELVPADRSGIIFTVSPAAPRESVVEAVHGLNQGLVDGTIEPDRWVIDRESGTILSHTPAQRENWMVPSPSGVSLEVLPRNRAGKPPLRPREVRRVVAMGKRSERAFGAPQDMEWCFRETVLYTLQSRPITTPARGGKGDERPWYLSLHRSFENLKALRHKVEETIIPGMERDGASLAAVDLEGLDDDTLAAEIERRRAILRDWNDTYTRDCIPMAHGMRLFGQVYNDTVKPADPFEFMDLLRSDGLAGLERNRALQDLARQIAREGLTEKDPLFREGVDRFIARFGAGGPTGGDGVSEEERRGVTALLLEMARAGVSEGPKGGPPLTRSADDFLDLFGEEQRPFGEELLELGRASYRLRDDDNIALGRVEREVARAVEEGRRRLKLRRLGGTDRLDGEEIVKALRDPSYVPLPERGPEKTPDRGAFRIQARQIVGQPAGPGIATGRARVILDSAGLFEFKTGEILVCDAVDPNMTFVVPLAAAIVERRGGMLIHGAIIAREYGLPCVTGIPGATQLIRTGDHLTVDGYLGIVIIGSPGRDNR